MGQIGAWYQSGGEKTGISLKGARGNILRWVLLLGGGGGGGGGHDTRGKLMAPQNVYKYLGIGLWQWLYAPIFEDRTLRKSPA